MLNTLLNEQRLSIQKDLDSQLLEKTNALDHLCDNQHFLSLLPSIGTFIPNITLYTPNYKPVEFHELLQEEAIILHFYQGTWNPYCNLELGIYEHLLKKNPQLTMVALSPELPHLTRDLFDFDTLPYNILCDKDNSLANALNLTYEIPNSLLEVFEDFGIDLYASQGNTRNTLPLPITFIIDKNGMIVKSWFHSDITYRKEPSEILDYIKGIKMAPSSTTP